MAELLDQIKLYHPTILKVLAASGSPGLSLGVLHHGKIIHTAHFGRRDAAKPTPPNDDTVYRFCSLTKSMTASVIAILVDEGVLDWDIPIREYLPDFADRQDAVGREATLRDLLSHRTGLSRADNSWGQQYDEFVLSKSEMYKLTRYVPAARPFRSSYIYNQWNYLVVSEVVEKVCGKSIDAIIFEKLLKPLGLNKMTFGVPSGENISKAHSVKNDGTVAELPFVDSLDETKAGMGGAWGCKGPLKDLLIYYKLMLSAYNHQKSNKVNTTPGSPFKRLQTVMGPHIALGRSKIENEAYCLGLNRISLPGAFNTSLNGQLLGLLKISMPIIGANSTGKEVFFHNGTFSGNTASAFLIPSSESAVVVFSNATPFMDATEFVGQIIVSLLLGEEVPAIIPKLSVEARAVSLSSYARLIAQLEKGKTGKSPQYPPEAYEGSYWNAAQNIVYNIKSSPKGGLKMTPQNLPLTSYDLLPYDGDTFYWPANREEELKKGMWPIPSIARHKVIFGVDGSDDNMSINTLSWHHDPMGKVEVFVKKGNSRESSKKSKI